MSDLMISSTPTPPASTAGNANALSQSDAANRSDESAKTDGNSGPEKPFAAVLKSKIDKKAAVADTAKSTASDSAGTKTEPEEAPASVDLSALLPLLGAAAAGTTNLASASAADTKHATVDPDQKELSGSQPAVDQIPTQILAAVSFPPATHLDTASRKQNAEARDEMLASGGAPAKTAVMAPTVGKIALDAAITADGSNKNTEKNTPELPASDFHVLMERAAALAPGLASQANGASPSPSLRIDTPLGQTGWHDEVGQKLTWMLGNNQQRADLVLTPPHLGRIEVSLTMNGDQAAATFTSASPAVREALENSLHRLREVLADAGVNLGQTHVGSESPNQSSPRKEMDFSGSQGLRYAATGPVPATAIGAITGAGRGMIDIFA